MGRPTELARLLAEAPPTMASDHNASQRGALALPGEAPYWVHRYAILIVAFAPLFAQLVGSAFSIWYNVTQIRPLLTPAQHGAFVTAVGIYNVVIYPTATVLWIGVLLSLRKTYRAALYEEPIAAESLLRAQRRAINLPWWIVAIAGPAWLLCIPTFLTTLAFWPDINPSVLIHLPISLVISALIALTHSFFAVELLSQSLLFPPLFRDSLPADTPGAFPITLRARGILWAVSAGVCPIVSLLLLAANPSTEGPWFAIYVGVLAIAFGLVTAWMLGQLVTQPVHALRRAAREVAGGNLKAKVDVLRADEFGPLIREFNHMVSELREKQRLHDTFGRHVGQEAARQILAHDPGLGGVEQTLTIMFADLRNFTTRCGACTPQEAVAVLNRFFTEMVEVVEQQYGGMVNKYLGDGFMAMFGAGRGRDDHARQALAAGQDMLIRLEVLNRCLCEEGFAPLAMGVGLHTGPALVGSIGSEKRLEYTAIGDTVNIASRVESLTKPLGEPLLLTAATRGALGDATSLVELPPQHVKGLDEPLTVYAPRPYE